MLAKLATLEGERVLNIVWHCKGHTQGSVYSPVCRKVHWGLNMQHLLLLPRTLLSKSSQLCIVIMRTLAFTHCRKVIFETMTMSVIIAAQVFEAPSRPSQQLTSCDY